MASLIRGTWPRSCAKHAASAAGRPVASAKPWIRARKCPDADTLLFMLASSQELRNQLRKALDAYDSVATGAMDAPGGGVAGAYSGQDRRAASPRVPALVKP